MNPLASRKKLLIAESELNRAQLIQEWQTMAGEVHALTGRARTFSALASAAAALITGLLSFRHKQSAPVDKKPSWLKTILKGAGVVASVWQAFRPQGCEQKDESGCEAGR
jgi:hypothetical protein